MSDRRTHSTHPPRARAETARRESTYGPTVVTLLAAASVALALGSSPLALILLSVVGVLLVLGETGVT